MSEPEREGEIDIYYNILFSCSMMMETTPQEPLEDGG